MRRLLIAVIVIMAISSPALAVNLLTNGDFSNGTTGWTLWTQRVNSSTFANVSGQCKFGGSNFNGGIWQGFATTAGTQYVISGWGQYWSSGTNQASWSEVLVNTTAPVNGTDYTTVLKAKQETLPVFSKNFSDWTCTALPTPTLTFTGTGGTMYLVIKHGNSTGSTQTGLLVDNIVVEAVPEPAGIVAMFAGLGGLALRRRR